MISFTQFLNEGLIKLPEKMYKDGETKIVSDVCSYVVTELNQFKDDPEINKFIEHVKKTASKYAAPLRFLKKKTRSKLKIEFNVDDLPKKYREHIPSLRSKTTLELDLDWSYKGRLSKGGRSVGIYTDTEPGKIVIGISSITELDLKKKVISAKAQELRAKAGKRSYKSHLYDELIDLFDPRLEKILSAFEHELTHYVQMKFLGQLSPKQISGEGSSKSSREAGELDAYYNSQVEFDPLIKNSIAMYHGMEKENLQAKLEGNRREWIDIFVGAKSVPEKASFISSERFGGFVEPSNFFLSLKKHSPDKWKKAVKLFTQELNKRYPLNEEQLDEKLGLKQALAGAALAGALSSGTMHHPRVEKTVHAHVAAVKSEAEKTKEQIKKLTQVVLDKYKIAPTKAEEIVKLTKKHEDKIFPKAPDLLAIIGIESSFNPQSQSHLKKDKAIGLTQVRPKIWGISPKDLAGDIDKQIKLASEILNKYYHALGSKDKAVHAYNVGLTNVRHHKGLNPHYIEKWKKELTRYAAA